MLKKNLKKLTKILISSNLRDKSKKEKKRLKLITIVNQFFPPDFAATGQLLNELSEGLSRESDFNIKILTGWPSYAYKSEPKYKTEKFPSRTIVRSNTSRIWPKKLGGRIVNSLFFSLKIGFNLLTAKNKEDLIIYTTEPPFLTFVALIIHFFKKNPYIFILYDLYPDVIVKSNYLNGPNFLIYFWNKINKIAYDNAKNIIVLSDSMKEELINKFPSLKNKISIIPSWVDHNKIKPLPKNKNWFINKYNLARKFVVLYSGNQGRFHDLVTIIDTAKILKLDSSIIFVFIGNGPQNKRIRDLISKLELNNCLLLPYQKLQHLSFSLSSADLAMVTLNKNAEGLIAPSKLYGHLCVGTPIAAITPNKSYLRKIIEKEECGKWFANGESLNIAHWIKELQSNNSLKKKYSHNARAYILREITFEKIKKQYLKIINSNL